MLLEEADGVAAALLGMVVPLAAANSDAVIAGQAFLAAGRDQLLASTLEKSSKIGRRGLFFLLLGKGNKVGYIITFFFNCIWLGFMLYFY